MIVPVALNKVNMLSKHPDLQDALHKKLNKKKS
jgi:hypothetical protein